MTSPRQIIANRKNALKSTGPRTEQGKAIVIRNALKHGLLARRLLLPDEDELIWDEFYHRLCHQLNPQNDLELLLTERVIAAAWRLRRLLRIETEMMAYDLHRQSSSFDFTSLSSHHQQPVTLGSAVAKNLAGPNSYDKLRRYETHLERSLFRTLHELHRLRLPQFEP